MWQRSGDRRRTCPAFLWVIITQKSTKSMSGLRYRCCLFHVHEFLLFLFSFQTDTQPLLSAPDSDSLQLVWPSSTRSFLSHLYSTSNQSLVYKAHLGSNDITCAAGLISYSIFQESWSTCQGESSYLSLWLQVAVWSQIVHNVTRYLVEVLNWVRRSQFIPGEQRSELFYALAAGSESAVFDLPNVQKLSLC